MRCNLIEPRVLTDQHLNAERRELRMIPPLLEKRVAKYGVNSIHLLDNSPINFTLNKGHMLFWLDKFRYLHERYNDLVNEMLTRGFKPDLTIKFEAQLSKDCGLYAPYTPDFNAFSLIEERLRERILQKPKWYKFHREPITPEWFLSNYYRYAKRRPNLDEIYPFFE